MLSRDWARVGKLGEGVIKGHRSLCCDDLSGFVWRAKNNGSACLHLEPAWLALRGVSIGECSVALWGMPWVSLYVLLRGQRAGPVEVGQWQILQLCESQVIPCFEAQ